jgi:hypothetical protein
MNQVPEKQYLGQWTIYSKNVSSQCNLTAHVEPIQDTIIYVSLKIDFFYIKPQKLQFMNLNAFTVVDVWWCLMPLLTIFQLFVSFKDTYILLSCIGSTWAVKLHWLDTFLLYMVHWPRYCFSGTWFMFSDGKKW